MQHIDTIVGTGVSGYSGDGENAINATLNTPQGICIDIYGNLYIADTGNNVIRKVSRGIITTIAGNGLSGYSGDNNYATLARLNSPIGVAINSTGSLFITDSNNNVIRKVDAFSQFITTIVGTGTAGFSGAGSGSGSGSGPGSLSGSGSGSG